MNNPEYIARVLDGDRDAYGALVEAYQGMAFAVALTITKNYEDSRDVVQEAFVRAFPLQSSQCLFPLYICYLPTCPILPYCPLLRGDP